MAEVTQSQFDLAFIRRSQEDHKLILNALEADGVLTIVADAPPEDPEVLLDDEGNEVEDSEGNPVLASPEPAPQSAAIEITVENTGEELDEEDEEEAA